MRSASWPHLSTVLRSNAPEKTTIPMSHLVIGVLLGGLVAVLLAYAPQVSRVLVRSRARRLPGALSRRMEEEWLAELDTMVSRPSQLAFAIALTLTRRHSFAVDDDSLGLASSRPSGTLTTIGGRPTVVVASTMIFAALAYGASFFVQPMYRSTARLVVVPSRIPAAFVGSPVRPLQARLQRIRERVLSWASLETVIRAAPVDARGQPVHALPSVTEAAIERMRGDIHIQPLPDGQFEISYVSPDPYVAKNVASRVAGLFVIASERDRVEIAGSSGQFLDSQIHDVRSRLLLQTAERGSTRDAHTPEAELRELEHEHLKSTYRALLMKREHSRITLSLDESQLGEQFKLSDAARLPHTPISPDRQLIAGEGAGAGFLLGITMMVAGRSGSFQRIKKARARS